MTLPPLPEFLRWLGDMPAVFLVSPRVTAHAVVADLSETLFGARETALDPFRAKDANPVEKNRLRWILAACHLLWHPAFRTARVPRAGFLKLLTDDLAALAPVVPAERLRDDEERREELVRRTLRALGLRLPGESEAEAKDRLTQVDSAERQRLLAASVAKEKRARELREKELRRRAEEEAASKATRE